MASGPPCTGPGLVEAPVAPAAAQPVRHGLLRVGQHLGQGQVQEGAEQREVPRPGLQEPGRSIYKKIYRKSNSCGKEMFDLTCKGKYFR